MLNLDSVHPSVWHFSAYAQRADTSRVYNQGKCLADYIYSWVLYGNGADVCRGNFTELLAASLLIVDFWSQDPTITDSRGFHDDLSWGIVESRPVETVFENSCHSGHPLLNPNIFSR